MSVALDTRAPRLSISAPTQAEIDALHHAVRVTHVEHGGAELASLLDRLRPGLDHATPRRLHESGVHDAVGIGCLRGDALDRRAVEEVCSFAAHVTADLDARDVQLETERSRTRALECKLGALADKAQVAANEGAIAREQAADLREKLQRALRERDAIKLDLSRANEMLYAARVRAEDAEAEADKLRDDQVELAETDDAADRADRERRARKEHVRGRLFPRVHRIPRTTTDTEIVDVDEPTVVRDEAQVGGGL